MATYHRRRECSCAESHPLGKRLAARRCACCARGTAAPIQWPRTQIFGHWAAEPSAARALRSGHARRYSATLLKRRCHPPPASERSPKKKKKNAAPFCHVARCFHSRFFSRALSAAISQRRFTRVFVAQQRFVCKCLLQKQTLP